MTADNFKYENRFETVAQLRGYLETAILHILNSTYYGKVEYLLSNSAYSFIINISSFLVLSTFFLYVSCLQKRQMTNKILASLIGGYLLVLLRIFILFHSIEDTTRRLGNLAVERPAVDGHLSSVVFDVGVLLYFSSVFLTLAASNLVKYLESPTSNYDAVRWVLWILVALGVIFQYFNRDQTGSILVSETRWKYELENHHALLVLYGLIVPFLVMVIYYIKVQYNKEISRMARDSFKEIEFVDEVPRIRGDNAQAENNNNKLNDQDSSTLEIFNQPVQSQVKDFKETVSPVEVSGNVQSGEGLTDVALKGTPSNQFSPGAGGTSSVQISGSSPVMNDNGSSTLLDAFDLSESIRSNESEMDDRIIQGEKVTGRGTAPSIISRGDVQNDSLERKILNESQEVIGNSHRDMGSFIITGDSTDHANIGKMQIPINMGPATPPCGAQIPAQYRQYETPVRIDASSVKRVLSYDLESVDDVIHQTLDTEPTSGDVSIGNAVSSANSESVKTVSGTETVADKVSAEVEVKSNSNNLDTENIVIPVNSSAAKGGSIPSIGSGLSTVESGNGATSTKNLTVSVRQPINLPVVDSGDSTIAAGQDVVPTVSVGNESLMVETKSAQSITFPENAADTTSDVSFTVKLVDNSDKLTDQSIDLPPIKGIASDGSESVNGAVVQDSQTSPADENILGSDKASSPTDSPNVTDSNHGKKNSRRSRRRRKKHTPSAAGEDGENHTSEKDGQSSSDKDNGKSVFGGNGVLPEYGTKNRIS